MPVLDYCATLSVVPLIDGDCAFIEWPMTFDCPPERLGEWVAFFRDAFGGGLESLRRRLNAQTK